MNRTIEQFKGVKNYKALPKDIVDGIEKCVEDAFGGTVTRQDARQHMSGDQILVLPSEEDESIQGFAASKLVSPRQEFGDEDFDEETGLYLAAAAIRLEAQGSGVYSLFNEARIKFGLDHGVRKIFTRTQNPRVQEGVTKSIEKMIEDGDISDFSLSRVIREGIYGRMLTAEKPVAKDLAFNDLDFDRGDAFVVTWDIEV